MIAEDGESVRYHIVNFYSKLYSSEPTNRDTADFFLNQLNSRLPNHGSESDIKALQPPPRHGIPHTLPTASCYLSNPKKGDLNLISYWRPISLQCCDAKILSKNPGQ